MSKSERGGDLLHKLRTVRWFEWLHHGYVVAASIGILIVIFGGSSTAKEFAYVVALLIYFLVLLVFSLGSTYSNGKKARYAEALGSIHASQHVARDLYRHLDWCSGKNHPDNKVFEHAHVKNELVRVLTSLSQAFSIVSGFKCRTSIKILQSPENSKDFASIHVITLARDLGSLESCRDRDSKEGKLHLLMHNTDFCSIIERAQSYFICNDVINSEHYQNSSFKLCPDMPRYRSTVVWPIRYVYKANEIATANQDQDVYGFLTVDSFSEAAFNDRYDVDLGAAVADSLFPVMHLYWKLGTKNRNNLES